MKNIEEKLVKFIKDYVANSNAKGIVVGMSGGKDSFVSAALATKAIGSENVFGVIMPNGQMKDLPIAEEECKFLKINYSICDIKNTFDEIEKISKNAISRETLSDVSSINLAPRIRMTTLYTIAGTLGYLVMNTSNLSETMIGYSTKWGDNVGDFAPLMELTKSEVCELGLFMELPENYVLKQPDDGLSGKTDEEKIGFSYDELDEYIRTGKKRKNYEKFAKMHVISKHKRKLPEKCRFNFKNHFDEN